MPAKKKTPDYSYRLQLTVDFILRGAPEYESPKLSQAKLKELAKRFASAVRNSFDCDWGEEFVMKPLPESAVLVVDVREA